MLKPRIPAPCALTRLVPCQRSLQTRPRFENLTTLPQHPRIIQQRSLTTTRCLFLNPQKNSNPNKSANDIPAIELNHNVTEEEKADWAHKVEANKEKQIRTPWHRDGSDQPPVGRQRSAGAMTKGKLLTTPSRMLKLILPLTTSDTNTDRKDVEPLALLVHPQQPLSYLERLIQAELPTVDKDGHQRVPNVHFYAEDSMQDEREPSKPQKTPVPDVDGEEGDSKSDAQFEKADEQKIDGKTEKTGKLTGPLNKKSADEAAELRGGHGQGGVESYSGLGHEAPSDKQGERKFVRWSTSTEIGDFIRDAARGQQFAVEIEGAPHHIRVGVPSFNDRTYYLRMRLRNTSKRIADMALVKKECDKIAHKGAQRVAMGGFGVLCGWWYLVYRLTFETDLGWDVMEPVTYLVGLSTLIGGYVWFLYHNREVSYRSAMNFTISRRQSKLYMERGFDLQRWESLVEEGNALRKEIKAIANEYDVDWDERNDEKDERVVEALKKHRHKKKAISEKEAEKEDDEPA